MRFLVLWDQGKIVALQDPSHTIDRIMIMLFQTLVRVLQAQNPDGSWDQGQLEPSAYAILTLVKLYSLPICISLRPNIDLAIRNGRNFIFRSGCNGRYDYIWIEKVTYYLPTVHYAFILAASNARISSHNFRGRLGGRLDDVVQLPMDRIAHFKSFYANLPLFTTATAWLIEAALIEGYLWLPQLRNMRLQIFPRRKMEDDRYFEYIPFTWTASNILEKAHYRASFLWEMMIISFLNYQVDEYMESVVGPIFKGGRAYELVNNLFDDISEENKNYNKDISIASYKIVVSGEHPRNGETLMNGSASEVEKLSKDHTEVYETLRRFIEHSVNHPAIQKASKFNKDRLYRELRLFLLAHTVQIDDNGDLSRQQILPDKALLIQSPNGTFFDWIRGTSSNHTSCPYSFAFAICLVSDGKDFFSTSNEKYLGQAGCRHLATLCRMYNDYGSYARDCREQNLNCLHFPEFHTPDSSGGGEALKEQLFRLADYERKCLEMTIGQLKLCGREETVRFMQTFVNVTDMYGQIYVERDIASRLK